MYVCQLYENTRLGWAAAGRKKHITRLMNIKMSKCVFLPFFLPKKDEMNED
ncbi:MAG: hypothetical protein KatS3mg028_1284 [Bacteroidia bacterium]|nr:MAG: hypothetical protein KatS3mg028_1284 [Bacteroidia bacterium]